MSPRQAPFDLLRELYGDQEMSELFSPARMIESWMRVEAALAQAQATCGILDQDRAEAIDKVCADVGVTGCGRARAMSATRS